MAQTIQSNQVGINNPIQKQAQGTGFVNIQRILNANKNNQLAGNISSGIQQGAQQVGQQLGEQQTGFQNQIGSANQGLGTAQNRVKDVINTVNTNPNNLANDPNNAAYQDFANYRNLSYQGPQGFDQNAYQNLYNKATDISQQGKEAGTYEGRQDLLGRYVNSPNYTGAQKKLDTLFLTGKEDDLRKARQAASGVQQNVQSAGTAAQQQAEAIKNAYQNFAQNINPQLQQNLAPIEQAVQTKLQQAPIQQQAQIQGILDRLKNKTLTPEDAAALGIQSGQHTFGIQNDILADPNQFINRDLNINKSSVANPQELAQMSALQRLMGQNPDVDLAAKQYDPNKSYNVNTNAITAELANRSQGYDKNLSGLYYNPSGDPTNVSNGPDHAEGITSASLAGMPLEKVANLDQDPKFAPMLDPRMNDAPFYRHQINKAKADLAKFKAAQQYNPDDILYGTEPEVAPGTPMIGARLNPANKIISR